MGTTADETSTALMHVLAIWGFPEKILSDGGPENQSLDKLVETFSAKLERSVPHAATGNAYNERSHRTINEALRIACSQDQTTWAKVLPQLNYCLNTTPMSMGISPYDIVYARRPRLLEDPAP